MKLRIAPSPTGNLHIGNARTALFNWLYAKANNGKFLVRIDDTDTERSTDEYEKNIIENLRWLGLDWDEGIEVGESNETYRQSSRFERYIEVAEELEKKGLAYREEGALRFKVPDDGEINFEDIVRGKISVSTRDMDDKILFKSDGMPTYHLANVVDDHLMKISHVIRGEEWLPSLALHNLIYNAFGWTAPRFAHLPLILKPTGKGKLSKRDGDQFGFPVYLSLIHI